MTRDFTNEEVEIYNNQLKAKSIGVGSVMDSNAVMEYTKKQLETEIESIITAIKTVKNNMNFL